MGNCVFCNYNENKKIRESENTFTLLSNPYLLEGHCLVIPKIHYESLDDVPEIILIELITEVIKVSKILRNILGVRGIDLRQNFRPFLPESKFKVNHVHFHVIPRELEDELYQKSMRHEADVFKDLDLELLNDLLEKLK